jgi:hypothetical protein
MRFYSSPAMEAAAVRRSAGRAGCVVRELAPGPTSVGTYSRGRVECPDGWAAAKMLLALAVEDAHTPGARRLAAMLRGEAPTDAAYRARVQAFVKASVRFAPEVGEIFQNGGYSIAAGVGDCDDHARLVFALYLAGRLPAFLAFLHKGAGPTHVTAVGCAAGSCEWVETTVDARIGEHPYAAAARLGLLKKRQDISREVVLMSEKDLAPVPPRYLDVNEPAAVALDVKALQSLGYLDACVTVGDAADPVFREAILALQLAHGIGADGLTGPQTRATITGLLAPDSELGREYREGAAARAVSHTKDLSPAFFQRVIALNDRFVARGARTKPEYWIAVWNGESGVRASSRNSAGYGGLIGLNGKYLGSLHFPGTLLDFTSLSAEAQLPIVERFYESISGFLAPPGGAPDFSLLDSPEALYAWNYLPAYVRRLTAERPIFATRANDPNGFYRDNAILDRDGDGVIDLADLRAWVALRQREGGARWIEVRRRLYEAAGTAPEDPSKLGGVATVVGVLGASALAAYQVIAG